MHSFLHAVALALALQAAPSLPASSTAEPSAALESLSAHDISDMPSIRKLTSALARSNLHGIEVGIKIEYAAGGEVLSAELVESTGSKALDSALLQWAQRLKFKPKGSGGVGVFPMELMQQR